MVNYYYYCYDVPVKSPLYTTTSVAMNSAVTSPNQSRFNYFLHLKSLTFWFNIFLCNSRVMLALILIWIHRSTNQSVDPRDVSETVESRGCASDMSSLNPKFSWKNKRTCPETVLHSRYQCVCECVTRAECSDKIGLRKNRSFSAGEVR